MMTISMANKIISIQSKVIKLNSKVISIKRAFKHCTAHRKAHHFHLSNRNIKVNIVLHELGLLCLVPTARNISTTTKPHCLSLSHTHTFSVALFATKC